MHARHAGLWRGVFIAHLDHLCSDRPLELWQTSGWEAGEMLQAPGLRCHAAEPRVSSGTWGAQSARPLGDVSPGTAWATTSSRGGCGLLLQACKGDSLHP